MANQSCHFEIGCRDRVKSADFYSKMCDWKPQYHGAWRNDPDAFPLTDSFGDTGPSPLAGYYSVLCL